MTPLPWGWVTAQYINRDQYIKWADVLGILSWLFRIFIPCMHVAFVPIRSHWFKPDRWNVICVFLFILLNLEIFAIFRTGTYQCIENTIDVSDNQAMPSYLPGNLSTYISVYLSLYWLTFIRIYLFILFYTYLYNKFPKYISRNVYTHTKHT